MRKGNKRLEKLKHQVKRNHNHQKKLLAEQSDPSENKAKIKNENVEHHSHVLMNWIGISDVIAFICLLCDGFFIAFFNKSYPLPSVIELSITNVILIVALIMSLLCWRRL